MKLSAGSMSGAALRLSESGKPAKRKRAPSHNSAVPFAKKEDDPTHDVVTPEMSTQTRAPETSARKANDEQTNVPVKSKIKEDEDALVDALLSKQGRQAITNSQCHTITPSLFNLDAKRASTQRCMEPGLPEALAGLAWIGPGSTA